MAKILSIVSYPFLPAQTGGQRAIALLNRYLSDHIELHCLTTNNNRNELASYITIPLLSTSKLRYINILYFFTIRKYIRRHHISHLLLEHCYYGWLALLLKYSCNIKLVIHSHNIESTRWRDLNKWWWRLLWQYERWIERRADYNFYITEDDRQYAIRRYGVAPGKCTTITYGIERDQPPTYQEKQEAKNILRAKHSISEDSKIFLFNGALGYKPNADTFKSIINEINPMLLQSGLNYVILVCGKGLPERPGTFIDKNIRYTGFVEDIDLYFKGADVFINPVIEGGGIKTKLVEALGWNTKSVSTANGAIGVTTEDAGEQLIIVKDRDWKSFAAEMIRAASDKQTPLPDTFYKKFSWKRIVEKALAVIRS